MKARNLLASIFTVVLVRAVPPPAAESQAPKKAGSSMPTLTAVQALPLTCAQAWGAAQKSYPQMLAIVTTLAKVSLANRDLTFPKNREAGLDAGKGIADDCKADPDALLFAIVDKQVRRVAEATGR